MNKDERCPECHGFKDADSSCACGEPPLRSSALLGRAKRFGTIMAMYLSFIMVGVGVALIGPWAMITAGAIGLVVIAWIMSK